MFTFSKMKGFQKPHVAAVPFPALGHSIPFFDMATLLAARGLTVSYVTTPANVSRLQQHITEAVNNGLDIRLVVLPTPAVEGLEEGIETIDLVPLASRGLIYEMAEKLQQPFNCWIETQLEEESQGQGTGAPVCIVYDLFIKWAPDTGNKYKIASFLFNSIGAFAMSLLHSVSASILNNSFEKEGDSVIVGLNLLPPLRLQRHEISVIFSNQESCNPIVLFFLRQYQSIGQGCGMLINSFQELEPAYLQHLENITNKPVWAIGPLLPPSFYGQKSKVSSRGKMADINDEQLLRWLDSQRLHSTVYVLFGSHTTLSDQQMNALARSLEASEQPFVWAIKVPPGIEPGTSDSGNLTARYFPEGFQERTKDRSLIIWGWAPQLLILSHPCVGAFMSHCGWNSTLESITHGVPIIAWPIIGDQHFNAKLVADLGMGIQFCQHRDGIPQQEKVKEIVKLVLKTGVGKEMKISAEKLKEMARKAVEDGGSSKAGLQAFVNEMNRLKKPEI